MSLVVAVYEGFQDKKHLVEQNAHSNIVDDH